MLVSIWWKPNKQKLRRKDTKKKTIVQYILNNPGASSRTSRTSRIKMAENKVTKQHCVIIQLQLPKIYK